MPAVPMWSITSTWSRIAIGAGDKMPAREMRVRLRISFSAHILTIFRGLLRE